MQYRLLLFILSIAIAGLGAQSSVIDSLDRELQRLAGADELSGNLLLAQGDSILLRRSYGYADFGNRSPLREDAVFELASLSKQFTAAAVSLLVADKKLVLDAPVMDYLPELAAYPSLTTRQLVHHTGGLPDYMSALDSVSEEPEFVTNAFILAYLRDEQPQVEFAPGEAYSYSNTGYTVLAALVERVGGQPFGEFLRQRLFEPLGMDDTQVYRRRYESDRSVERFAPGYVWEGDRYVIPDSLDDYAFVKLLDGVVGDGMVNSTLDDLYRWDRALARAELLDTALLFQPGVTTDGDTIDYGFGQKIRQHPTYGYTISHTGGWPGMATFLYRFPGTDRTLIFLRNDDGGRNPRINALRSALRALHGMSLGVEGLNPPQPGPVDPATVRPLLGTYVVEEDYKFTFSLSEDDDFEVSVNGGSGNVLGRHPELERYMVADANVEFEFSLGADGEAARMIMYQGTRETVGTREE